eukprot:COSAG04_NODE_1325_length_7211_cov_23.584505_5_plen_83_part_00
MLSRGAVETLSKTSEPRSLRRARRLGLELGCAIIMMPPALQVPISVLDNVDALSSRARKVKPSAKTLHGPFMTGYVLAGCGG